MLDIEVGIVVGIRIIWERIEMRLVGRYLGLPSQPLERSQTRSGWFVHWERIGMSIGMLVVVLLL